MQWHVFTMRCHPSQSFCELYCHQTIGSEVHIQQEYIQMISSPFFLRGWEQDKGICDISKLDGDNGIPGCSQRLVHFPNVMTHSLQSPRSGESGLGRVSRAPFSLLGSLAGWLVPTSQSSPGFRPRSQSVCSLTRPAHISQRFLWIKFSNCKMF